MTRRARGLRTFAVAVGLVLAGCAEPDDATTPDDTESTVDTGTTFDALTVPATVGTTPAVADTIVTPAPATTSALSDRDVATAPATTSAISDRDVATPVGAVGQPDQPAAGPGGRDAAHGGVEVSSGGEGADAWFVFEPVDPRPSSAPLAIVLHGYGEFTGYEQMAELIGHTVRGGTIVVYPRWQVGVTDPCPGPFDAEPCLASAVSAIDGALDFLRSDPSRVEPDVASASYFGFSFGGVLAANLGHRHAELGLPRPTVLFLDEPHDGGLAGHGEPTIDDSLVGIPSDSLVVCHVGASGTISEPDKSASSCNALWPRIDHIPDENKRLVSTSTDDHGRPVLSSAHGVCAAPTGSADAYDWNFCWATWDALRDAAARGDSIDDAMPGFDDGDLGTWSDGTPIAPLLVRTAAPITPDRTATSLP